MKRRACAWVTCALGVAASSPAAAAKYAAMEQVPVEGGELRLASVAPAAARGAPAEIAFPLKHTSVEITVSGPMARYVVEQVFDNPFDEPIEAVYLFPLGVEAAVHDYAIVVGDRTIRGQIDTRENARKRYEEARADGRTAAILEEQKRNVFSQSVANIPPRQAVRVRFSYVELVEHRDGAYELVFPMVVGPRYLPGGATDPRPVGAHPAGGRTSGVSVPYVKPGTRSGHELSVRARIDAGVPMKAVTSPSHAITQRSVDETTVEVELAQGDSIPNKDLVLRYGGAGEATMVGLLTHREARDGFFTVIVQPKASYRTGDIAPREVVLVIDRSGSMQGAPLAHAKVVAGALLASLGPADAFNVIAFADGVDAFAPGPVAASEEARRAGTAWIEGLQAGGGTELGGGVGRSLARRPGEDRTRMVYLITDGYVGNDDEILAAVKRTVGVNRIFPVGVGSATNRYLLDRLGQLGRGYTSYLLPSEPAAELAATLVRRTAFPHLTDVKLVWEGLDVTDVVPQLVPDVYAGMPIVVSGRYRKAGKGKLRVEATAAGARRTGAELEVELPEREVRPEVAYLWARARVSALEALELGGGGGDVKKQITELGLAFKMVTAYTSFVAVDERRVQGGGATARTIVQPAEMPEGVSWEGVFGDDGSAASSSSYAYSPPARVSHRGRGGGGGGGGGGAIDPFTLLTIASFVPLARALRKKRRERSC